MRLVTMLLIFFITACSQPYENNNINNNYSFSNKMSFNEFKVKLNEYADNNPYPNIDD